MGKQGVEILATFVDYCRQTDDFWTSSDDNEKFQFSVVLKLGHNRYLVCSGRKVRYNT